MKINYLVKDYRIDLVTHIDSNLESYTIPTDSKSMLWLGGYKPSIVEINMVSKCIKSQDQILVVSLNQVPIQLVFPLFISPSSENLQ